MSGWQNIKRNDLYKLVWQQPMTRLARNYGLSDVGLAKLCRRHDIPRPPRGYWAQKEFGKAPKQTPLPNPNNDVDIQLREPGPETPPSKERVQATEKLAREDAEDMKIEVAADLENAHPLVQRARQDLQDAKVDTDGLIEEREKEPLSVVTSKECLNRALLIMDAVIRGLEHRGYAVKRGPEVEVEGVVLKFSISEDLETKRESDEKTSLDGPYEFNHSRFKETQVPSGILTLTIENGEVRWGDSVRRRWRDTEKARLESRLNKFVAGLIEVSVRVREFEAEKKERAERERLEKLEQEKAARVLEARRKEYKKEKARLKKLLTQAENFQMSRNLRELIKAVKVSPATLSQIAPDIPREEWLEWATRQADRLDPLIPSPPSILDDANLDEKEPDHGYGSSSGFGYDSGYNYGYRNHWRR
jgi:hypothetical protein